jgi:hypothetical protein
MRRISLIGVLVLGSALAMTVPASARLGTAPPSTTEVQDNAIILVKGGHGHGRGHMGRGGRGHHYGWGRGRGHHYGWGRGHRRF